MLPFLKPKQMSTSIIAKSLPDGGVKEEPKGDDPGLMSAAEDLISAIHAKDAAAVASALKAAIGIVDSDDVMEGEA